MACGGESDMDVCRAGEHPPAGTPLLPKPAYGPSAKVATIPQQKAAGHGGPAAGTGTSRRRSGVRSEEHTSELQSLMRISYAVFCLKKKKEHTNQPTQRNVVT